MEEFYSNLLFEETGGFDRLRLRRRPELESKLAGFNVAENARRVRGHYRPARNHPVYFRKGNQVDQEGFVAAQGKFLIKYDYIYRSGSNWSYNADVGLDSNGTFAAYIDSGSGTAVRVRLNDPYWGYSESFTGFVALANGTTANANEVFSSLDVGYNAIHPSTGNPIAAGDTGIVRPASFGSSADGCSLAGVAFEDTMRETRNNNYNYQRSIEAFGVCKEGYLVLPFVIEGNDGIGNTFNFADTYAYSNGDTPNSVRRITDNIAVLLVSQNASIESGLDLSIDMYGNPVLPSSGNAGNFASLPSGAIVKLVDYSFDYRVPMGLETDTYPGLEIEGKGTAGLISPVYAVARKIHPNANYSDLRRAIENSRLYGVAHIYYSIP